MPDLDRRLGRFGGAGAHAQIDRLLVDQQHRDGLPGARLRLRHDVEEAVARVVALHLGAGGRDDLPSLDPEVPPVIDGAPRPVPDVRPSRAPRDARTPPTDATYPP